MLGTASSTPKNHLRDSAPTAPANSLHLTYVFHNGGRRKSAQCEDPVKQVPGLLLLDPYVHPVPEKVCLR